MNKRKEYSLAEIFSILSKKIWVIVLCIVIGAGGAFLLSKYVMDDVYTASVSMYVAPNQGNTDMIASINDLDYAKQVANTYVEILKTNAFMTDVAKKSGLEYSVKDMSKMIKIKVIENTEIFQIQVNSNNARNALIIADTIAFLVPQKIMKIAAMNAVRVVDPAIIPTKPTAPNLMINTIIGFVLGAMLSIIAILIFDIIDKRIKDENDIVRNYNICILGTVAKLK